MKGTALPWSNLVLEGRHVEDMLARGNIGSTE